MEREATFKNILALCDITERMITAIEQSAAPNKEALLDLVAPVATSVDIAVQALTETFIGHLKDEGNSRETRSLAVNMAMKGIYEALYRMKDGGERLVEHIQMENDHDQTENHAQ